MSSPCFCVLLRTAARRVAATYDAALAPVGVNIAQFALLRAVARTEPVALTELGRRLELDRSTIGRNSRVLERMGLVALGRGTDQREAMVSLTEAGREVITAGLPLWDAVQHRIAAELGEGKAAALREILGSL
ncbi:MarR family transcriptional regulator [Humitalea rosea]|uniref:MarR family transcriptional regulator n=1 Tax=Humitalea rosea TaxID=990373 RepID=A0A2W7KRE4_9PROT|nr:MarR family transcriptional regulator [Humitalea rosea]PZW51150.1 MarR family transcriptional regulator [Humitalea rosea]